MSVSYFSAEFLLFVCSFQHTDMPEEMRVEAMELCVTACEKYATNNEVLAQSQIDEPTVAAAQGTCRSRAKGAGQSGVRS